MATSSYKISVIEHSRVSPPQGTVVAKLSLPLNFYDISVMFLTVPALFFYKCSNSDINSLIQTLKHSLSVTLKHFLPFAGNLILYPPTTNTRHEIRYQDGDSVAVTFATCGSDFDDLMEKNPVNVTELLPFSPRLNPLVVSADSIVAPVLTIQVTFFQTNGICIGFTREHVASDANTWVRFVRAWASITKTSSDESFLAGNWIPSFDRSVITDSENHMYNLLLSRNKNLYEMFRSKYQTISSTHDSFRGTFVITQAEIQQLKKLVLQKTTNLQHISSFVVVCAYIWSCLSKTNKEGKHADDEVEQFGCTVSVRDRVPTIPDTYFGNCFVPCSTTIDSATLTGENGLIVGVEKIGEIISNTIRLNNEAGISDGFGKYFVDLDKNQGKTSTYISGSPRFSLHDIDLGWGIPKQTQYSFSAMEQVVSLNGCNDPQGGLEIGLSFPKHKMDAFIIIFKEGLNMD